MILRDIVETVVGAFLTANVVRMQAKGLFAAVSKKWRVGGCFFCGVERFGTISSVDHGASEGIRRLKLITGIGPGLLYHSSRILGYDDVVKYIEDIVKLSPRRRPFGSHERCRRCD